VGDLEEVVLKVRQALLEQRDLCLDTPLLKYLADRGVTVVCGVHPVEVLTVLVQVKEFVARAVNMYMMLVDSVNRILSELETVCGHQCRLRIGNEISREFRDIMSVTSIHDYEVLLTSMYRTVHALSQIVSKIYGVEVVEHVLNNVLKHRDGADQVPNKVDGA